MVDKDTLRRWLRWEKEDRKTRCGYCMGSGIMDKDYHRFKCPWCLGTGKKR